MFYFIKSLSFVLWIGDALVSFQPDGDTFPEK